MHLDTLHAYVKNYSWNGDTSHFLSGNKEPVSAQGHPLRYKDKRTGWYFELHKDSHLKLQGSVNKALNPRILNPDNLTPQNLEDFRSYLSDVSRLLGLDFDVEAAQLNRVDLFLDKKVEAQVAYYVNELGRINDYGRMKQQANSHSYNSTYVRWGNHDREIVFYNKGQHLVRRAVAVPEGNWLRAEARLLHRSSCVKLGLSTIGDTYDQERLKDIWCAQVLELLGAAKDKGVFQNQTPLYSDEIATIRQVLTSPGIKVDDLVDLYAAERVKTVVDGVGGLKEFRRVLKEQVPNPISRMKLKRCLDQLERLYNIKTGERVTHDSLQVWPELQAWIETA